MLFGDLKRRCQIQPWQQVDVQGQPRLPVGGDLQDGRAAQALVCEEEWAGALQPGPGYGGDGLGEDDAGERGAARIGDAEGDDDAIGVLADKAGVDPVVAAADWQRRGKVADDRAVDVAGRRLVPVCVCSCITDPLNSRP